MFCNLRRDELRAHTYRGEIYAVPGGIGLGLGQRKPHPKGV